MTGFDPHHARHVQRYRNARSAKDGAQAAYAKLRAYTAHLLELAALTQAERQLELFETVQESPHA